MAASTLTPSQPGVLRRPQASLIVLRRPGASAPSPIVLRRPGTSAPSSIVPRRPEALPINRVDAIPPHNIGIGGISQWALANYRQLYPGRSGVACQDAYGAPPILAADGTPILYGWPGGKGFARLTIWRLMCLGFERRLPPDAFAEFVAKIKRSLNRYTHPLDDGAAYDENPPDSFWEVIFRLTYLYKVLRADSRWSRVDWNRLVRALKSAEAATKFSDTYYKEIEQVAKTPKSATGTRDRVSQQRRAFAVWVALSMKTDETIRQTVDRLGKDPNGNCLIPGTGTPENNRKLAIAAVRKVLRSG